jgi:hypothetical protein
MRIVGGKDYYDSASAYGIDPGITFVRDNRALTNSQIDEIGHWKGPSLIFWEDAEQKEHDYWKDRHRRRFYTDDYWRKNDSIDDVVFQCHPYALIFCGKIYRGLTIVRLAARTYIEIDRTHFWSAEKLAKWCDTHNLWAQSQFTGSTVEDGFRVTEVNEAVIQALVKYQASIVMQREQPAMQYRQPGYADADSGYRVNFDGLKDIGFQSAIDPVTAFQELSMWVGGTLSSAGPNTVEITDDKIKVAKHGFDQWSFRKKTDKSK